SGTRIQLVAVAVVRDAFQRTDGSTGSRRNQATDDDVLFQAAQRIDLAGDSRLGENAGGFLEGSRGDERAGLQRRFGDTLKYRRSGGHAETFLVGLVGDGIELITVNLFAGEEGGLAGIDDFDLLQHLAQDDFDVLVVDGHTPQAINLLDFIDHITRKRFDTHD